MKNRWKNAMNELRGNRGSGVVLVLVAISCITLMTTSLLHLSYTAFKIKASDRQSKTEFYATDAKLDKLMAGIQEIASDAAAEAQKKIFINFSASTSQAGFHSQFIAEMENSLKGSDGKYNVGLLNSVLNDASVTIANDSESVYAKTGNTFVLKNVRLTYLSEVSGNLTTVKADIVIDCDNLDYKYVQPDTETIVRDNNKWNFEEIVRYENWSTY